MATIFSGSDWLEKEYKGEMSPFGKEVADLLGQVWAGIYHLHSEVLNKRAEWSNDWRIEIVTYTDLSTFDFDVLTKLVVMAHDRAIRLSIAPASSKYLRLIFHKREREGGMSQRHPTMEQAIDGIRERIGLGVVEATGVGLGGTVEKGIEDGQTNYF